MSEPKILISATDLAKIFAGFTRIEFGPDECEQVEDAWNNGCSEAVREAYLEEATKYIEVLRQRRGIEVLRRMYAPRTDICGAQSDDDPPVTCSCEPGHDGDHMGGTRCGTVTWPRGVSRQSGARRSSQRRSDTQSSTARSTRTTTKMRNPRLRSALLRRVAMLSDLDEMSFADDGDRADGEAQSDDIEREESIAEALEYVASRMRHRNRPESPDGSNHSTLSNSPPRPDDERISLKLEPIVLANEAQRPMLWQIVRRLVEEGNVPRTDNPRVDGDRERADRLQNEVHTLKRALDSSPDRAKQYLAMSRDDVARLTKENQRMAKRIGSLRKALAVAEGREPRSGTAMPAWKCDHSTRDVTPDGRSCRACTAESFRSLMSELVCAWDRYSPDEDVGMVGLVSKIEAIRAFIGGAGE